MENIKNLQVRTRYILFATGILSILIGLTYVMSLYGPTEAEVGNWGVVSIVLGVITIVSSFFIHHNIIRIIGCLITALIVIMQILPIWLWFVFHGAGISDGTPPSSFIAHWGYSIPHLALLIMSIIFIIYSILLLRNKSNLA